MIRVVRFAFFVLLLVCALLLNLGKAHADSKLVSPSSPSPRPVSLFAAKLSGKSIAFCQISPDGEIKAGRVTVDGLFQPHNLRKLQSDLAAIKLLLKSKTLSKSEKHAYKQQQKQLKKELRAIANDQRACKKAAKKTQLTITAGLTCGDADLTHDGLVNNQDILQWVHYFQHRNPNGDFDGNSRVQIADLTILLQRFDGQCAAAPSNGSSSSTNSTSSSSSAGTSSSFSSADASSSSSTSSQPSSSSSLSSSSSSLSSSSKSSTSSSSSSSPPSSSSSSQSSQSSASSSSAGGNTSAGPIAVDHLIHTTKDTLKAFSLPAASRFGGTLSYSIVVPPVHGTVLGTPPHLFYQPNAGYTGQDQLIFGTSESGLAQPSQAVVNIVVQNPDEYSPPTGIPTPAFGITQTVANVYGSTSFYTHWVDNRGSCSNSGNGTSINPRCSIPGNVPAGSVVVIAGGTYSGLVSITAAGTAAQPIIYRGLNQLSKPLLKDKLAVEGAAKYVIIENIALDRDYQSSGVNIVGPAHHITLRHSDISDAQGEILIYDDVDNIVIFNNNIHDGGDLNASGDIDDNGIIVGQGSNVWILDNEVRHTVGSGIVLNPGFGEPNSTINRAFVGRNTVHHVRQSGLWSKQSSAAVFSSNLIYNILLTNHTSADGIGYQYGPENLWIINNRVFDCEYGIRSGSNSVANPGLNTYIIGNIIHDIHDKRGQWDPNDTWTNGAIVLPGGVNRFIYNNTIFAADSGIAAVGDGGYTIANNIIAGLSKSDGNSIWIPDEAGNTTWTLTNNLFGIDGNVRIKIRNTLYTTITVQSTFPALASQNLTADPKFINAGARDFHLLTGSGASPAIDRGATLTFSTVYQTTFTAPFTVDYDGTGRGSDGDGDSLLEWDIGAYEE